MSGYSLGAGASKALIPSGREPARAGYKLAYVTKPKLADDGKEYPLPVVRGADVAGLMSSGAVKRFRVTRPARAAEARVCWMKAECNSNLHRSFLVLLRFF